MRKVRGIGWRVKWIVGFLKAPKFNFVVITSRSKQLTRWMPGHPPNPCGMCIFNFVDHARGQCCPKDYLTVLWCARCTCKQLLFVRVPRQHSYLVIMTFEAIKFLFRFADVEYLNFLISTSCQKPIAVYRVPPYLTNSVIMCCYSVNTFSTRPWVPNLDQVVFAASQN